MIGCAEHIGPKLSDGVSSSHAIMSWLAAAFVVPTFVTWNERYCTSLIPQYPLAVATRWTLASSFSDTCVGGSLMITASSDDPVLSASPGATAQPAAKRLIT